MRTFLTMNVGDKCFLITKQHGRQILKVTFLGFVEDGDEVDAKTKVKFHLHSIKDNVTQEVEIYGNLLVLFLDDVVEVIICHE